MRNSVEDGGPVVSSSSATSRNTVAQHRHQDAETVQTRSVSVTADVPPVAFLCSAHIPGPASSSSPGKHESVLHQCSFVISRSCRPRARVDVPCASLSAVSMGAVSLRPCQHSALSLVFILTILTGVEGHISLWF